MKRYFILILIALSFTKTGVSQFSTSTELQYLQLINKQGDKRLIADNLRNAELAADSIITQHSNNLLNAYFFAELGKSYFLVKQYDKALLSFFRQHYLFPNDSADRETKNLFFETAFHCHFTDNEISQFWDVSKMNVSFNKRLIIFLEQAPQIHSRHLRPYILKIGNFLKSTGEPVPIFYHQWESLVTVNMRERHLKTILPLLVNNSTPVYKQVQIAKRLRLKIYRKTIRHFLHINAYRQAFVLLNDYRTNEDLSFFQKADALIKRTRIAIRF